MKRLIFILFLLPTQAFSAMSATGVWELNASGGAGNLAGCYFNPGGSNPGTDYTQLAGDAIYPAAKFNGTDLASTSGTTNPCVVTSASHNFVAADVRNSIHVTAGTSWTSDYYEIVSVAGNAATLDKACGSSASISGGTWYEGGGCSLGVTGAAGDTKLFGDMVAGNTIWIHSGTYSGGPDGDNITTTAGTATSPVSFLGYNSTRGDNPTGSSRPYLNGVINGTLTIGNYTTFSNIRFSNSDGASMVTLGQHSLAANDQFISYGGVIALQLQLEAMAFNVEVACPGGTGVYFNVVDSSLAYSYVHDSTYCIQDGANGSNEAVSIVGNILENCTTAAIYTPSNFTSLLQIMQNTLYGAENKLGIGVDISANAGDIRMVNNIFYGFTTGVTLPSGYSNMLDVSNAFYNNTTNTVNWAVGVGTLTNTNPQFSNIAQVTGTAGHLSSATLTDSGASFSNVTNNVDFVNIISGTGATAGLYLITGHTGTTLTLASAPGGSGTNINYQVTTGHNFAIGPGLKRLASPGAFQAGFTTNYQDIGAVQRREYGRQVIQK